jgi:hypothetical protein
VDFDYVNQRVFASRRCWQILGIPLEPDGAAARRVVSDGVLHPADAPARSRHAAHLDGLTPAYEGEWRVRHPATSTAGCACAHVRGAGKPLRMAGSV